MSPAETTCTLHGLVTRVASEPRTAPRGGYPFRGIELTGNGEGHRIFLICPDFAGVDLFDFPLLCWEGANISAYRVRINNTLDDGSLIFTAAPESLLLVEPHIPVSVTEAVEAAQCIRSADLRFRVGPEEPFWMAKGKLIHSLFDHLINSGSDAGTFAEAFRRAVPDLKAAMTGSGINTTCASVQQEALIHFQNLKAWLDANLTQFSQAEIETERTSRQWGLKGRSDALFRSQAGRRTILELKSGKIAAENHLTQLSAYHLLFSEEEDGESTEGCLLYSATGKTESVGRPILQLQRLILQGRNRIVALKKFYGLPGGPDRDGLEERQCDPSRKCFSRSACLRLFGDNRGRNGLLRGANKAYYDHWFRLLSIEDWEQEQDFVRRLDPETLSQRVTEGTTLAVQAMRVRQPANFEPGLGASIEIGQDLLSVPDEAGPDASSVHLVSREYLVAGITLSDPNADLSPGEEVLLHSGDPCAKDAFRARVIGSADGTVLVNFRKPISLTSASGLCDFENSIETAERFLDRIPFSRGPQVARRMLFRFFLKADPKVVRSIVGSAPEEHRVGAHPCVRPKTSIVAGAQEEDSGATERGEQQRGPTGAADTVAFEVNGFPRRDISYAAAPDRCAEIDDLCFSEGLSAELNEDQESAVRSALAAETYHLVHGPPGTGKTRVLARLIRICLDRGERVLLVCPTNVALDRLLIATLDLGVNDLLRIGRRSSASAEFLREIKRLGNPPVLLEDLSRLEPDFAPLRKRVFKSPLVAATAYQCASHPVFLRQRFDRVIVDEAGQLDEPSTLGPISLAKRFILGGDHLQLPPVVQSRKDSADPEGTAGLERSLFERLFESSPPSEVSRLKVQYRMNLEVQSIPSRLFYDGTLLPAPAVASRRLSIDAGLSDNREIDRILDPELPVVFVDVRGNDTGKAGPEEADAAARITKSLLACGVPSEEVGIITPYRAQQALIRKRLAEALNGLEQPSVDTVDRFQGGEREVIILSLARSDGVTSFLADRKRLNVSLSRARSKLILLGHGKVLQEHPLFADILQGLPRITVVT